jgi:hypothetical protein
MSSMEPAARTNRFYVPEIKDEMSLRHRNSAFEINDGLVRRARPLQALDLNAVLTSAV